MYLEASCHKYKEPKKINTKEIKISKAPEILILSMKRILSLSNRKMNFHEKFSRDYYFIRFYR